MICNSIFFPGVPTVVGFNPCAFVTLKHTLTPDTFMQWGPCYMQASDAATVSNIWNSNIYTLQTLNSIEE